VGICPLKGGLVFRLRLFDPLVQFLSRHKTLLDTVDKTILVMRSDFREKFFRFLKLRLQA
jgi:hypothetical protein